MKRVVVLILIIALILGAAIAFASNRDGDMAYQQNNQSENSSSQGATPKTGSAPNKSARSGTYTDYSESAVANANGSIWIFFHAPWCPQCRALEADIKKQGVPAGLTILKADYDTSTKLRQAYGVTLQTTVVRVDNNGKELGKFVAYDDPTLTAVADAIGM